MELLQIAILAVLTFSSGSAFSSGSSEIYLFDGGKNHPHHLEVKSILESETRLHCPGQIQVKDFSLFDDRGKFDSNVVVNQLKKIEALPSTVVTVLHFSWNDREIPEYSEFEKRLSVILGKGHFIVAAAGENVDNPHQILKLLDTVMGRALSGVSTGFIIGELTEGGHLAPRSHYGADLFTALAPSRKKSGSSFSAPLFTARLACAFSNQKQPVQERSQALAALLRKRKTLGSATYPTLSDLFR
jgi:hypothetical protein